MFQRTAAAVIITFGLATRLFAVEPEILDRRSIDGPKIDDRTVFEIGSITKAFPGVLLADAVE